jgi:hypothetical protein
VRDLYFTDVAASVGAKKNNGRCTFCGIVVEGKVSILETHILQCKQAPEEAKDTVRDRAEAADTPEPGASRSLGKGTLGKSQSRLTTHFDKPPTATQKSRLDELIFRLFACHGIAFTVADSEDWKELMKELRPAYAPPGILFVVC